MMHTVIDLLQTVALSALVAALYAQRRYNREVTATLSALAVRGRQEICPVCEETESKP